MTMPDRWETDWWDRQEGTHLPGYLLAAVLLLAVGGWYARAQGAERFVVLGPADALAFDQPRVSFGLFQPGTFNLVGPQLYNLALLDTGASGVLLGQLAYIWGEMYEPEQRANGQPVIYYEQGVGGVVPLTVYRPYDLAVAGDNPWNEFVVTAVRVLGDASLNLGSFAGVVGMPAMVGRVTVLDLEPMLEWEFISVDFPVEPPTSPSGSYSVALSRLALSYSGQVYPTDPLPTFAELPLIPNVGLWRQGTWIADSMVLDTGAQNTFISTTTAQNLGIDWQHTMAEGGDVVDWLEVEGVGGTVNVPLVAVDRLIVPTAEGVDLVWTDLLVGVLDIPGVSGIFGMNLLTSGYIGAALGGEQINWQELLWQLIWLGILPPGTTVEELQQLLGGSLEGSDQPFFARIILDLRQSNAWQIRLEVNSLLNLVRSRQGDLDGDGDVDETDLAILLEHWGEAVWVDKGNLDGQGVVDDFDLNRLLTYWTGSEGLGGVPEPGTGLVGFLTAGAITGSRRLGRNRRERYHTGRYAQDP